MFDPRNLVPLIDELDAFEARVRELAHAIVGQVFATELARRAAAGELDDADGSDDAERDAGTDGAPADATTDARPDTADGAPSPTRTSGAPPGRGQWTRELVVDELARWLLGGNPLEAAFLVRHGNRALVTNAKKFFGRFEAALNAANLHLAKQYPEGIPSKKKSLKG